LRTIIQLQAKALLKILINIIFDNKVEMLPLIMFPATGDIGDPSSRVREYNHRLRKMTFAIRVIGGRGRGIQVD